MRDRRTDDDFSREIEAHLALEEEQLVAQGLSVEAARAAARRRFGNVTLARERFREAQRFRWWDDAVADVRFAWRLLRRDSPATMAAIVSLALGIGATTAIFSAINAVLLRPLPFPRAQDLYTVRSVTRDAGPVSGLVSSLEMSRLPDPALSVAAVAWERVLYEAIVLPSGEPRPVTVKSVSQHYFDLFEARMILGRRFGPADYLRGADRLVILSHRVWRDLYASSPEVLGKSMSIQGLPPRTIVGVAGSELDAVGSADLFWNLSEGIHIGHVYQGYLRAEPGATRRRLESEMDGVMSGIASDTSSNTSRAFEVRPLVDTIAGDLRPVLLVVLYGSALLLLIGATNVSSLLLARGAARSREIAARMALGAGAGRIVRQLLTEALVLCAAGTILGAVLAVTGLKTLVAVGRYELPRLQNIPVDPMLLAMALIVTVVTSIVVGLAPALHLSATDVRGLLNDGGRAAKGGHRLGGTLRALMVADIAAAMALVASAGWIVQSFERQLSAGPGFATQGRLITELRLDVRTASSPQVLQTWWDDVSEGLRALPDVVDVGFATGVPFRPGLDSMTNVRIAGIVEGEEVQPAWLRRVSPRLIEAMGVKLLNGRGLTRLDQARRPPAVVINRALARLYGNVDLIGRELDYGYPNPTSGGPNPTYTIVGIVDDVKYQSMAMEAAPAFYMIPFYSLPRVQTAIIVTRLDDPTTLIPAVRDTLRVRNPTLPLTFERLSDVVDRSLAPQRFGLTLMLAFAAAAVLLAAVGIHAVIKFVSKQREPEMAVRLALGATAADVFWLTVMRGGRLVTIGVGVGLLLVYAAGQVLASHLVAIVPTDPLVVTIALVMVVTVALVGVVIPARRAAGLDVGRTLTLD